MEEIEVSSMVGSYTPGEFPGIAKFEAQSRIKVRQNQLLWANAWQDLLLVVLYFKGPDISEIGSTWLGSLIRMELCARSAHKISRY